jgi:division protein CdvB (Snf7/Vps24/ESCRT-III family)
VELIVLGAITIELFSLYNHTKLDHRIDEHILDTDRKLEKTDVMIQILSNNMNKLDEHITRYDEHMNKLDEHITRYDEHMNKLDEHINRLDDIIWKYYIKNNENITDNQVSKDNQTS